MNNAGNSPMMRATGLWAKTSVKAQTQQPCHQPPISC
jgi:hypothetical protein